jgi:uncharacterized membrane protein YfcA
VLLAVSFFSTLDLRTVRWLVIVVVLYTAITMLLSATTEDASAPDLPRSKAEVRS